MVVARVEVANVEGSKVVPLGALGNNSMGMFDMIAETIAVCAIVWSEEITAGVSGAWATGCTAWSAPMIAASEATAICRMVSVNRTHYTRREKLFQF